MVSFSVQSETHSDLNLTTDIQTAAMGSRLLEVKQHDTYSRSFQRPFGHTIKKQADKHNGCRWGYDDDEAGLKWRILWVLQRGMPNE